jgi:hypothetical protein
MLPSFTLAELAHAHLLLNHFPTVAFSLGVGLYLVAIFRRSEEMIKAGLIIFLVIALLSLPVYMSGRSAQDALAGVSDVSEVRIDQHEDAALLALVFMEITGALAWLGLWQFRQLSRQPQWNVWATLFFSIITFALMARAANMGGNIRHPEIAAGPGADSNTEWLQTAAIAKAINDTEWAWGAMETIHFVGLSLLFGTVLVVSLRMLGALKIVPFSALHRLLPWGILGFGLNLVSGMLFFIAVPTLYTQSIAMPWKMATMILGGLTLLYFTLFDEPWALGSGDDARLPAKIVGLLNLVLWVVVIFFGRMIPYIGNV